MADIINFKTAKKDNIKDKVKFLSDLLVNEHRFLIKHINDMLIFDKTIFDDKSTSKDYIINIIASPLMTVKINASKNKLNYTIVLTDYERQKNGTETTVTLVKEPSGEYEITKKRKRVIKECTFVECKFTKASYSASGKLLGRITYLREEENTVLIQENASFNDQKLVNFYGYDNKLNLISMLKGYKKEKGYVFYDGFTNNLRIPEDKALFALGIKDILIKKTKFTVRSARVNELEVITLSDIDILNNKKKVIDALKEVPKLNEDYKNAFEKFEGMKKYKNEFDENVIIIKLNDGKIYKYTKKMSTIFDIQAEKYKCFYENDFLNPNNIVSEVEALTYPLVPIKELIVSFKNEKKNIVNKECEEEYSDSYLTLKRVKVEKEGTLEDESVIFESEWNLETIDMFKKQYFVKTNNIKENYEEYDYLCLPSKDKVGFRFLTREYNDETLKEVFAFGKLDENGKFKSINSIYMRKNSVFDAIILKSVDEEDLNPEKVFMDYGKVANIETQIAGIECFEYNVLKDDFLKSKIYVNANKLSKFLDDVEEIEKIMLEEFYEKNKNMDFIMTDKLKEAAYEKLVKVNEEMKKSKNKKRK